IKTTATDNNFKGIIEFSMSTGERRGIDLFYGLPVVNYGASLYKLSNGSRVDDGAWHHLAATFDGTATTLDVEGVAVSLSYAQGNSNADNSRLAIGSFAYPSFFFTGIIDEVRVYNRALTAQEITSLYQYNNGSSDTQPPTIPGNLTAQTVSSTQI